MVRSQCPDLHVDSEPPAVLYCTRGHRDTFDAAARCGHFFKERKAFRFHTFLRAIREAVNARFHT